MSAIDLRVSSVVAASLGPKEQQAAGPREQKRAANFTSAEREHHQSANKRAALAASELLNLNLNERQQSNLLAFDRHYLHQLQRNELCLQWQLAALQQQQQQHVNCMQQQQSSACTNGRPLACALSASSPPGQRVPPSSPHKQQQQQLEGDHSYQSIVFARLKHQEALLARQLAAASGPSEQAKEFAFKSEQQQLNLMRKLNILQEQQQQQHSPMNLDVTGGRRKPVAALERDQWASFRPASSPQSHMIVDGEDCPSGGGQLCVAAAASPQLEHPDELGLQLDKSDAPRNLKKSFMKRYRKSKKSLAARGPPRAMSFPSGATPTRLSVSSPQELGTLGLKRPTNAPSLPQHQPPRGHSSPPETVGADSSPSASGDSPSSEATGQHQHLGQLNQLSLNQLSPLHLHPGGQAGGAIAAGQSSAAGQLQREQAAPSIETTSEHSNEQLQQQHQYQASQQHQVQHHQLQHHQLQTHQHQTQQTQHQQLEHEHLEQHFGQQQHFGHADFGHQSARAPMGQPQQQQHQAAHAQPQQQEHAPNPKQTAGNQAATPLAGQRGPSSAGAGGGQRTPPQPPCSVSPSSSTSSAISSASSSMGSGACSSSVSSAGSAAAPPSSAAAGGSSPARASSASSAPPASLQQTSATNPGGSCAPNAPANRNSVTPPGQKQRRCGQTGSPLPPSPADSGVSDVDSHYSSSNDTQDHNAKHRHPDKQAAQQQQQQQVANSNSNSNANSKNQQEAAKLPNDQQVSVDNLANQRAPATCKCSPNFILPPLSPPQSPPSIADCQLSILDRQQSIVHSR